MTVNVQVGAAATLSEYMAHLVHSFSGHVSGLYFEYLCKTCTSLACRHSVMGGNVAHEAPFLTVCLWAINVFEVRICHCLQWSGH